jgi:hypothetical protein
MRAEFSLKINVSHEEEKSKSRELKVQQQATKVTTK